jgi:RNA polymerase sigma factor (sigma-70 family)
MFTSHRDAVWGYCYRRLPRDDVQDAVAEVFLVAWRRIDQAPDGDETLLWLYGVARNVVRNFHRSSVRRQRLRVKAGAFHQADNSTPEMQVIRRAEDRELLAAVNQLKPMDQELLRLRTWEELSHAEIASVVGMSTRSVESRLARVRKRLGALLQIPTTSPHQTLSPRPVEEGGER